MEAKGAEHHFFSNSINPVVSGGTFATVNRDLHIHSSRGIRPGLKFLLKNIARGAFHDAFTRGDPPRCHPQTRKAVLSEIVHWITSPENRSHFIMWLHGPAGAGKSAIAQSIAETCKKEGLLAASFFFARSASSNKDSSRFITTIAYQLSQHIPAVADPIFTAVETDPAVFLYTTLEQMKRLLIQPLRVVTDEVKASSNHPALVVIDGLDEGGDSDAQKEYLQLIGSMAVELQHIPIIFLVSSRPEYAIRRAFSHDPLRSLTRALILDDSYNPREDIRIYLESVFHDIKQNYSTLTHFPSRWPTADDMTSLIKKASGQFMFAAMVATFVDSPRHNPVERLKVVLGLSGPGKDPPFAALDALYRFILASVANLEEVLEILTLLILSKDVNELESRLHVNAIEELLGIHVHRALIDMHALLSVPPPETQGDGAHILIHHASMHDFLMDPSRSANLSINKEKGHTKLAIRWLKLVGKATESTHTPLWVCVAAFRHHYLESPFCAELSNELATFDLRIALELPRIFDTSIWEEFFFCVEHEQVNIHLRLQCQLDDFILSRLSRYPSIVRSSVPAIITMKDKFHDGLHDMLHLLFLARRPSTSDFQKLENLDEALLDIHNYSTSTNSLLGDLFRNKTRAGKYRVTGRSYANLAKQLIYVLYPNIRNELEVELTEFHAIDKFDTFFHDTSFSAERMGILYPDLPYFKYILKKSAMDPNLVLLLRDRTLHYKENPVFAVGQREIAIASVAYLEKYGEPYRVHVHRPDRDICYICDTFGDASVVDPVPDHVDGIPDAQSFIPSLPWVVTSVVEMFDSVTICTQQDI